MSSSTTPARSEDTGWVLTEIAAAIVVAALLIVLLIAGTEILEPMVIAGLLAFILSLLRLWTFDGLAKLGSCRRQAVPPTNDSGSKILSVLARNT